MKTNTNRQLFKVISSEVNLVDVGMLLNSQEYVDLFAEMLHKTLVFIMQEAVRVGLEVVDCRKMGKGSDYVIVCRRPYDPVPMLTRFEIHVFVAPESKEKVEPRDAIKYCIDDERYDDILHLFRKIENILYEAYR